MAIASSLTRRNGGMYLELPVELDVHRTLVDAQSLASSESCLPPENLFELCAFTGPMPLPVWSASKSNDGNTLLETGEGD